MVLFRDGVQLPQGQSHFEEAVYLKKEKKMFLWHTTVFLYQLSQASNRCLFMISSVSKNVIQIQLGNSNYTNDWEDTVKWQARRPSKHPEDKMSSFVFFVSFTECYMFISIIPNRHTKFIMHIFKIKTEDIVKAMKVTEILNEQTIEYCQKVIIKIDCDSFFQKDQFLPIKRSYYSHILQ